MNPEAGDSIEVMRFLELFTRVRDAVGDDPASIASVSKTDPNLAKTCKELAWAAFSLGRAERSQRQMFAAPVNPLFLATWRDFQRRYSSQVTIIDLSDLIGDPEVEALAEALPDRTHTSPLRVAWEMADDDAFEEASALETLVDFAHGEADNMYRDWPEKLREGLSRGADQWQRLKLEVGLDIRGILRRRHLVPFVLIPRHVSNRHGRDDAVSLFSLLQQAQDAYVMGIPLASLGLMRSVIEATLRQHYFAVGETLDECIKSCRGLPGEAPRPALDRIRRLANTILHGGNGGERFAKELEIDLLRHLTVLRCLIEGAPSGTAKHTG